MEVEAQVEGDRTRFATRVTPYAVSIAERAAAHVH
jgi:hypothetical protein